MSAVICNQTLTHCLQVAIDGPAETLVRRGSMEAGAYSFAYSSKAPGRWTVIRI